MQNSTVVPRKSAARQARHVSCSTLLYCGATNVPRKTIASEQAVRAESYTGCVRGAVGNILKKGLISRGSFFGLPVVYTNRQRNRLTLSVEWLLAHACRVLVLVVWGVHRDLSTEQIGDSLPTVSVQLSPLLCTSKYLFEVSFLKSASWPVSRERGGESSVHMTHVTRTMSSTRHQVKQACP